MGGISKKQSELFVTCWSHNIDWAETFLKEYFVTKAGFGRGAAIKLTMTYGVKQAKGLVKVCREEYYYDMPAMIRDAREGKFPLSVIAEKANHESHGQIGYKTAVFSKKNTP